MAEPKAKIQFTYEDYKSLPESVSEGERCELLEGDLVMVPSPTIYHQLILGNLEFILRQFVLEKEVVEIFH
jgi:Uma2 family endonuclease